MSLSNIALIKVRTLEMAFGSETRKLRWLLMSDPHVLRKLSQIPFFGNSAEKVYHQSLIRRILCH